MGGVSLSFVDTIYSEFFTFCSIIKHMLGVEIFLFIFQDNWHSCEILLVPQEMTLPTQSWRHLHTDATDASSDCGSSLWLEHGGILTNHNHSELTAL